MNATSLIINNPITIQLLKQASMRYNQLNGGFILAYHQIEESLFKSHLDILSKYKIVSLTEMVARKQKSQSTKGLISLTVDDCYKSTLPNICKVCSDNNVPITFFAPINFLNGQLMPHFLLANIVKYLPNTKININDIEVHFNNDSILQNFHQEQHQKMYYQKEETYMPIWNSIMTQLIALGKATAIDFAKHDEPVSWNFIREASKNDLLSFQSHGMAHQPVSALNANELELECIDSKNFIEEITQKKVNHFCYPYGSIKQIGSDAPKIIARHYDSAVTMIRGRVENIQDNFMLPRIPLYNKDTPARVLLKTLLK